MTTPTTTDATLARTEAAIVSVQPNTSAAVAEATEIIVSDQASYLAADAVLYKIRSARAVVEARMNAELTDPIIKPARAALDALYALRQRLTDKLWTPLEQAERLVKGKMARWQAEEKRREAEAAEERRREANRLAQEADLAKRQAEQAKTETARQRSLEEARRLTEQAAEVRSVKAGGPLKAAGSKITFRKVWRVTDMTALIAAVVAGEVPEIVLMVNADVMEEYWKQDRAVVSGWAGVSIQEETSVSGR
jgi:hypothetical protein